MKSAPKARPKKPAIHAKTPARKSAQVVRAAVKTPKTAIRPSVARTAKRAAPSSRPAQRLATPKRPRRFLWMVIVALVAVNVGLVGWRMTHRHVEHQGANDTDQHSVTFIPYTDTAGAFTLNYPQNWHLSYVPRGGSDGPTQSEPDWSKTSRPLAITPATGQKNNAVTVTPGCTAATIADAKARKDRFHTQQDININGYPAFYDKLDFVSDAEQYVNHTYVVLGPKDCLQLSYRESWRHPMSNTNFDDSQNVPDFKAIVNSVKFVP